ncbi:MAG: hypothetical protein IH944_01245 [Armatimonadetes bacterium]|nr:hypothetical protein [Armatimonadota bacterium]
MTVKERERAQWLAVASVLGVVAVLMHFGENYMYIDPFLRQAQDRLTYRYANAPVELDRNPFIEKGHRNAVNRAEYRRDLAGSIRP